MKEMQELIEASQEMLKCAYIEGSGWELGERLRVAIAAARASEGGWTETERIAKYVESESECLMPIVVEETKHDYGVRLLKVMADEIRAKFAPTPSAEVHT